MCSSIVCVRACIVCALYLRDMCACWLPYLASFCQFLVSQQVSLLFTLQFIVKATCPIMHTKNILKLLSVGNKDHCMLITFRVLVSKSFLKKISAKVQQLLDLQLATADLGGMDSSGINSVHWISNACSVKVL